MVMLLLVVGFIGVHWKLIAAIAAGVLAVRWYRAWDAQRREQLAAAAAERAAIATRADRQHNQVLRGDPRGTYGEYTPAIGNRSVTGCV